MIFSDPDIVCIASYIEHCYNVLLTACCVLCVVFCVWYHMLYILCCVLFRSFMILSDPLCSFVILSDPNLLCITNSIMHRVVCCVLYVVCWQFFWSLLFSEPFLHIVNDHLCCLLIRSGFFLILFDPFYSFLISSDPFWFVFSFSDRYNLHHYIY